LSRSHLGSALGYSRQAIAWERPFGHERNFDLMTIADIASLLFVGYPVLFSTNKREAPFAVRNARRP
jgi:hypothetical protein